jgi:hypothetical protein
LKQERGPKAATAYFVGDTARAYFNTQLFI